MAKTLPVLRVGPLVPGPVVGDLGLLVHGRADGVADVLTDDGEARRLGHVLDGPPHLVERVALAQLLDPRPQAALGHLEQLLGLLRDVPMPMVKAASPWYPSMIAPQSMETMSPSSRT